MKRGKKELKARMVARQQKCNRKITVLNLLLQESQIKEKATEAIALDFQEQLRDAINTIDSLQKKRWYQFVPFKFHDQ